MPLSDIQDKLIFKAQAGRFLTALGRFFREVKLRWSDSTGSARAFRKNGEAIIELSRKFFVDHKLTIDEGAELLMHEISHHLMGHFDPAVVERFRKEGYSDEDRNIAGDAIINAALSKVNCGNLMKRFYKDEGIQLFLRPHSRNFHSLKDKSPDADPQKAERLERASIDFYFGLYGQGVTLEMALAFFKEHFSKAGQEMMPDLLGSHGKNQEQESSSKEEQAGGGGGAKPNKQADDKANEDLFAGYRSDEGEKSNEAVNGNKEGELSPGDSKGLFAGYDVSKMLQAIGILKASRAAHNNFKKVVKDISVSICTPGATRVGFEMSRRFPSRLGRQEMFNIERERLLFRRNEYRQREVTLLMDLSASMQAYIPFALDLVQSLNRAEMSVKIVGWADRIREITLEELTSGKLEHTLGYGTNGEIVAQYLARERDNVKQAAIITDNAAGTIATPISTKIHLCLTENSQNCGSFLDRNKVPNCVTHQLKLR
jgi:hypothetical protein